MKPSIFESEVFRHVTYRPYNNNGREFMLSREPYLDIVINDHCNARCKFCIGHLVHKREWPALEHQERGIRYAIERMGVNEVLLLGGEPTINNKLFDYVDHLVRNFKLRKICLTTNGHRMALEEGYAERLFSCGITHINLSYMSIDPEKQMDISGTKVHFGIATLAKWKVLADRHGVHLRINNNVFLGNHDSIHDMDAFYRDIRHVCDSVKFSPLLKTDSFSTVNEVTEFNAKHLLAPEKYDELWRGLERAHSDYPIVRNEQTFGFVEYSMIVRRTPIILNYNQHGRLRQQVLKGFINNLKMLPTGDLSLSWNREEKDYFISTGE